MKNPSLPSISQLVGATILALACTLPDCALAGSTSGKVAPYVGTLKVYSQTEQRPDGDNTYRYIHTNYLVYSTTGKLLRRINNEPFPLDENPAEITLPKGNYVIEACSDLHGVVRLEVTIRTGRTASIHLEREKDWNPDQTLLGKQNQIKLPSGELIGCYE